ncbi:hypothetical protein P4H71_26395 [Paenibacillus kribbensis]|uniref:hypothetical protein n=1 Tax=Paenibacillus kribbensis TaxID=172713 RepID=UPI002DB59E1B|nr:hypothetical protein [Paenibacillus kribbensis]MEC0237851.1 hypothetical protein [Paenibacillus kribbensis]
MWVYDFVGPKQRYSKLFRSRIVEQALGSTAVHSARMQKAPSSSVQRMHNEAIPAEYERIYEQVWEGYSPYGRDCEVYANEAYAPGPPRGVLIPLEHKKSFLI